MKHELIRGYISRISAFATTDGHSVTARYLNKPNQRLGWLHPSGLNKLSELFHPAVPDANELMKGHTLFPLFRPFIPQSSIEKFVEHYYGDGIAGISASLSLNFKGLQGRWNLGICNTCINEDHDVYGFSYWRTGHIVPGLALCPYHLEPLYKFCESCAAGFRHSKNVLAPTAQCACGRPLRLLRTLRDNKERMAEEAISLTVKEILSGSIPENITHNHILASVSKKAFSCGYVFGERGLTYIHDLIIDAMSPHILRSYSFSTGQGTALHKTLNGNALTRSPLHNIILIRALFGSLTNFIHDVCADIALLGESSQLVTKMGTAKRVRPSRYARWGRLTTQEVEAKKLEYRGMVLELKAEHALLKRSDMKPQRQRDARRFLLKFDKAWFDEHLPVQTISAKSNERYFRLQGELDISLSQHIYTRHAELLSSNISAQITHRRLVSGHTLESRSKQDFSAYPLTQKALQDCVENEDKWLVRKFKLITQRAYDVSEKAPILPSTPIDGLSAEEIKKLIARTFKWLRKNAIA